MVSATLLSPLLVVLGPTGSGKSELALHLAQSLAPAEIVNFDSVQVYRRLDIGSAKLLPAERRGIPHHLIDIAEPDDDMTAGRFALHATESLGQISSRPALPILVGGTGFYLRALLDGLSPAPLRNQDLRSRLQGAAQRRPRILGRILARLDPAAAARIHANDLPKLIRAIELTVESGRPASLVQAAPRVGLRGYRTLKIGLAPLRNELCARLDRRTAALWDRGLVEETRKLLEAGVPDSAKSLQALGYKQSVRQLRNELSAAEAVAECQTRTRQYAKRQLTWFRAEREVLWLGGFGSDAWVQSEALALVRGWLSLQRTP